MNRRVLTLFAPHGLVRGNVALADGTEHIGVVFGPELLLVDDLAHQVLLGVGGGLCAAVAVKDAEEGKLEVALVLGLLVGNREKVLHVLAAALT